MNRCVAAAVATLALGAGSGAVAFAQVATVPVHGRILAAPTGDSAIAAIDEVPGIYPAQTRRFHVDVPVKAGETFDASLDPRTSALRDLTTEHLITNEVTPLVIIDSVVFLAGALGLVGLLIWVTKRVIIDERF